jgi:TetR/AcrR family transcriptional regulator, regulator of cefoperazone and chloramphenicol sensitivity
MAAPLQRPETRGRLLVAATRLFAERGFHGTKVRDIAERAGANVAAASYHFGSKEGLYLAVLRTQFEEIRERLERDAVVPGAAELDRLDRNQLESLFRLRIQTMVEFMIGPPTALHATLMIREMTDPSAALPVIVAEFIRPQIGEMSGVLSRLAPKLSGAAIERCIFGVIGQILFYCLTKPAQLMLRRRSEYPRGFARQLSDHVADFSLGGLDRLAAMRGGRHAA